MRVQLVCCRALGTQTPTRDRRIGIAFDGDQLAGSVIYELPTTDPAVRTNRRRRGRAVVSRPQVFGALGIRLGPGAIRPCLDLLKQWPAREKIGEHSLPPEDCSPNLKWYGWSFPCPRR